MDKLISLLEKYNLGHLKQELDTIEQEIITASSSSSNTELLNVLGERHSKVSAKIGLIESGHKLLDTINDNLSLARGNAELANLVDEENSLLEMQVNNLVKELEQIKLMEKQLEDDTSPAIFEFRPGVGGAEASLFAKELANSYILYINKLNYPIEILSEEYSENNDFKELIFRVGTKYAFGKFRFEAGVIRVQRVPTTETKGRVHTSTISLAVIPEIEDVTEIDIPEKDIRIDIYRSSGPGGQSVNTTDSAVRITHIPTSITVSCQSGKSQHQNKDTAMRILKSKILEIEKEKIHSHKMEVKKQIIKNSERSSKIRTFNFLQSRVTDHRLERSWFNINDIMNGELEDVITETSKFMRESIADQ